MSTATDDRGEPLLAVQELCAQAARRGDRVLEDRATQIGRTAAEPLRIGVTGRVNAGKSTLVNALVGQHVAQTGPAECTAHVIHYRFGQFDHVDVVATDGRRVPLRCPPDAVPADVGVPPEQVDHLEVFLSTRELADLVLVDTPGLGSLDAGRSARTTRLLGEAGARVDAAIFVFDADSGVGAAQHRLVEDFTASGAGTGSTVISVLSKADTAGDGRDPWPAAEQLARTSAAVLPGVGAVQPLCALLAETVSAGLFTESLADDLRAVAAADERTRKVLLLSADRFVGTEAVLDRNRRERLLDRLGLHGIRRALSAIDDGAASAAEIAAVLRAESRIGDLRDAMERRLLRHGPVIKAAAALDRLDGLVHDQDIDLVARSWLGDEIEELRTDPRLHAVQELDAVAALTAGDARLPTPLADAFALLATETTDAGKLGLPASADARSLRRGARELGGRFRGHAFRAGPATARLAVTAERSCLLIAQRARVSKDRTFSGSGGTGDG